MGFFLEKKPVVVSGYKLVPSKAADWARFHDDLHGPVQKFLHAAFYQEISYHDIISIWKDGFLYDEVLVIDVACNCPSTKPFWEYFTPRTLRTVEDMAGRDPRNDGYDRDGGRMRLKNRYKSYQKTSKQLKTTRKHLSRNKKNNTTRRKRYTIRRMRR